MKKSDFRLELSFGLDFGPSWPPFREPFAPPRWLKPVLEFLLERPRAVQENSFSILELSKSAPRDSRPLQHAFRRPRSSNRPLGSRSGSILLPCWTPLGCKSRLPTGPQMCITAVLQVCAGPATGAHAPIRFRGVYTLRYPAQRLWRASRLRHHVVFFWSATLQCSWHLQCILHLHSAFCICIARQRCIAFLSLKHHV